MIEVKCLASGSTGNAYAIDDGESVLLLEAGIPAKKILSGFLPLLPRVAGCLITHEHGDHSDGAAGLASRGIDLYATVGTFAGISGIDRPYRKHVVRAGEQFRLGSWMVLPFETKHDAAEPCGYLIYSYTAREKLLFATDTYYIPNSFNGLNIVMVECNYSLPLLNESIASGRIPESMKPRLLRSHFGLEYVKNFILVNNMSTVRHIYLLHLSGNNSDARLFKQEIQRVAGKPVTVF
ncbi:MBL fold metallo-hydrolase [Clostridium merdae]|uniref:MBL fold metallo-hydrolase n=1 Tax=Clostridium merdae TaxID=1958780 RepID=UPI000A269F3C|nr:MBL fold metallo-hydrolase [Clostridium merdae]